jgi:apolipoprotein N-acyltransferase
VHVQGTTGFTPYVRSGNNTVLAVSLLLLAFGFAFGPGRRNGRASGRTARNGQQ